MEFNPANPIVRLCIAGMAHADKGNPDAAGSLFMQAWEEADHDFEKYIAAYFIARQEKEPAQRLQWFETALAFGLKINDDDFPGALPALYQSIAETYSAMGLADKARQYHILAAESRQHPQDKGPFYHGTKADLPVGSLLNPGGHSNYKAGLTMNHIYFTALPGGAGLAAALAKGAAAERVYVVEPTGSFENDPNVTDKKFPGNPSRSYRSLEPLKIVGELKDWVRITAAELQQWRDKLAASEGDIIN